MQAPDTFAQLYKGLADTDLSLSCELLEEDLMTCPWPRMKQVGGMVLMGITAAQPV